MSDITKDTKLNVIDINEEQRKNKLELLSSLEKEELSSSDKVLDVLNTVFDSENVADKQSLFDYIYSTRKEKEEENLSIEEMFVPKESCAPDYAEQLIDEKYNILQDNLLYTYLVESVESGVNKLVQKQVVQSMKIDTDWIETLELGVASVAKIVKNPKIFIKEDRDLIRVDKAKRIDSTAMKFLSTHTEYIKEIREDNTVIPSKVLARTLNEDRGIYENRFVYALILRLSAFVERRYTAIKNNCLQKEHTFFNSDSSFKLGKGRAKYKLNLEFINPSKDFDLDNVNEELLTRLQDIKIQIDAIRGSKFYEEMSKYKLVKPPILKTNILLNNVDYRNCYTVWMMLSRYTTAGYYLDVKERDMPIDSGYFHDLSKVVASTVETAIANNFLREQIYNSLRYTQKKSRRHKVTNSVDYEISKDLPVEGLTDSGELNQYYFEKIKGMVNDISEESKATNYVEIHKIRSNFRQFYKGLQLINNDIYYSLLKFRGDFMTLTEARKATKQERKRDKKELSETIEKQEFLIKLKKDELRLATKRLQTLQNKLKKKEELERKLQEKENLKKTIAQANKKIAQDKLKRKAVAQKNKSERAVKIIRPDGAEVE